MATKFVVPSSSMASDAEEGTKMSRLREIVVRPIETTKNRKVDKDDDLENGEIGEENEEPLSPFGRIFHEDNFNIHILAIMGFKTKIDPSVLKTSLPHTLLKHPRFSSLMVEEHKNGSEIMKWVRTNVILDDHIIIPEIDIAEKDFESSEKFVEEYIYTLTKTRLDTAKPLWDLHILNVESSTSKSVAILRIHHSLGDGISLMSLLLACMRKTSDPNALPTLPSTKTAKPTRSTTGTSAIGQWFLSIFLGLWLALYRFWNTVVDSITFLASIFFTVEDSNTPFKRLPGSHHNSPRRVVFGFVSLDDMKLVKNSMKMTINDVAVAITQAGLSKYLNRRYGAENKNNKGTTQKKNNLPKNIRLRAILVINIRQSPGIQALADMMEKDSKAKWGNAFGYVLLPLTIGLRDDPLDYAREAKATVDRKKNSYGTICSFFIVGLVYAFLGVKSTSSFFWKVFNSTVAFSNVVGPVEEVGFYGHPMAYLAATTYGQANELMINFQSYANKMTIVLAVDENTIQDPSQLRDDIVESLKLIKNAVIEKGIAN